jgi:hypothetical protein
MAQLLRMILFTSSLKVKTGDSGISGECLHLVNVSEPRKSKKEKNLMGFFK